MCVVMIIITIITSYVWWRNSVNISRLEKNFFTLFFRKFVQWLKHVLIMLCKKRIILTIKLFCNCITAKHALHSNSNHHLKYYYKTNSLIFREIRLIPLSCSLLQQIRKSIRMHASMKSWLRWLWKIIIFNL